MSTFRNLLMQQTLAANDLTEVYAYAAQYNVTAAQVDAIIAEQPAMRDRLIAWKYLIHSLANTGCTPYLLGDGTAYINTEVLPEQGSDMEVAFICNEANKCMIGGRDTAYENGFIFGYFSAVNKAYVAYGGRSSVCTFTNSVRNSQKHTILITGGSTATITLDASETLSITTGTFTAFFPVFIYTWNTRSGADSRIATSATKISYVRITTGTPNANTGVKPNKYYGVPYCQNGIYGMLDLTTDTFKASAVQNGLFGYELRDSNNNTITI